MQGAAALKVLARSWMSGYLMRMRALHTHAGWRSMKGMVRQITATVLEVSVPPLTVAHENIICRWLPVLMLQLMLCCSSFHIAVIDAMLLTCARCARAIASER
jgi:hypothetical protein